MLKKVPKMFRFILRAQVKTDFQHSLPALSVSSLKLFEIPNSLLSLYALAQTVCVGPNLLLTVSEIERRFLWFYHQFKNNHSVYLED